jgi:hypothetical protein
MSHVSHACHQLLVIPSICLVYIHTYTHTHIATSICLMYIHTYTHSHCVHTYISSICLNQSVYVPYGRLPTKKQMLGVSHLHMVHFEMCSALYVNFFDWLSTLVKQKNETYVRCQTPTKALKHLQVWVLSSRIPSVLWETLNHK